MEGTWKKLREGGDQGQLSTRLFRMAHSLAGSGGTFGVQKVSSLAKTLEQAIKPLIDASDDTLPQQIEGQATVISALLADLKRVEESWKPSSGTHLPQLKETFTEDRRRDLLYLVEDDPLIAETITSHLESVGYQIRHFEQVTAFEAACAEEMPAAIIMDMVHADKTEEGANALRRLQKNHGKTPPVVFISVRTDMEARLAAARVGATRYFTKPIDLEMLTQSLDGFTARVPLRPYRVLIIDDDNALLAYYKAVLENAGMQVNTLSEPLQCLNELSTFHPDIVVSDVYMPECSGPELAQVIRQDDTWAHTPIMFLSTESNLDRQLAAMNLGGDDFITKPVEPEHLVLAVTARVKRARWVSRLNRDLQRTLRESEYRHISLDQHAIVAIVNTDGIITSINQKFCEVSGYSEAEIVGQPYQDFHAKNRNKDFQQNMRASVAQGNVWRGEICHLSKNNQEFWVEASIVPFLDDDGQPYQYVAAMTDVTELKRSRDEANQANRAKSIFLSSMSHELRTPLNAIIGFGQLLQLEAEDAFTGKQKQYIHQIVDAGNHLLQLINEVLDLSKIESGKMELSYRPVQLGSVLEDCLSLTASLRQEKHIHMQIMVNGKNIDLKEVNKTEITLTTDAVRLKQVILNLLSNAIKYNRDKGSVSIICSQDEKAGLHLSVVDTGQGFSAIQQEQLFKPFNRLGMEHKDIEGTGIGLVITRSILGLMGGNISLESEAGKGSTFKIYLPAQEDDQSRQTISPSIPANIRPQSPTARKQSILYIEDNLTNLDLVVELLAQKRPDLEVLTATAPLPGLEIAKASLPDVILLDINLPDINGYEVLARLRENNRTASIPVIAISANAMQNDLQKSQAAGFLTYVTKPFSLPGLLSTLDNVLSAKKNNNGEQT